MPKFRIYSIKREGIKVSSIQIGVEAPNFQLPATNGNQITLSDYQGKQTVILYFYPKDNTSG